MKRPSLFILATGVLAALSSGCGQPAEPPVQQHVVTGDPAIKARPRPAEPAAAEPAVAKPDVAKPAVAKPGLR